MSRRGRKAAAVEDDDLEIEEEEQAPRGRKKKVEPAKQTSKSSVTPKSAPATKKKRARKSKNDDDDDDDDDDDAGSGGKAKNFLRLPQEEQKMLVSEVARLMLLKHREKKPPTQATIRALILKDEYQGMRLSTDLVKQASRTLLEVFGMELVEFEKHFFLRSAVALEDPCGFLGIPDPSPFEGLAACVIGMLHTTKTLRLEETELFELLSAAADFREGVEHVVFGTYKNAILELKKRKYIVVKTEKDQHGEKTNFYSLGPRATVEWNLERTEALVSEVYGRPVDKERLKELELERGLAPLPENLKTRTPSTRAKKAADAPKSQKSQPKNRKTKFIDSDEEEGVFDDEE